MQKKKKKKPTVYGPFFFLAPDLNKPTLKKIMRQSANLNNLNNDWVYDNPQEPLLIFYV